MTIKKSKLLLFPLLLVLYEVAAYLSNDMYLPALPNMMQDLGLSTRQAQLSLTTWFLGSASLPLVMGVVSDRYGRRPVLLWGCLLYVAMTIVCALVSDANTLLIARFLEGAAIPSMLVAGYACIHELYEQKEAIRILALMSSITVLAPAFGPLLGSMILWISSWRGIFWSIAGLSTIAMVLLYRAMPETLPPEKRQPVHFGNLFRQYGRALLTLRFMLRMGVMGLIYTGFIIWITASPLLTIDNLHFSPFMFGVMQAIVFIAFIIGNHYVKYFLDVISVQQLIRLGLGVTLVGGVLGMLSAHFIPKAIWPFLIGMTTYSFGSALCFAPLNRTIVESSDEPMGVRMALFTSLWTGFGVIGSLVASFYFSGTIASIAYPLGLSILVSCLLWVVDEGALSRCVSPI